VYAIEHCGRGEKLWEDPAGRETSMLTGERVAGVTIVNADG